ncbi:MAG: hypothetical protein M1817_005600 [Caeruleum heppii]|nr:MAG: hypothetical protein M1817_005600 [Caeruleum heppii]
MAVEQEKKNGDGMNGVQIEPSHGPVEPRHPPLQHFFTVSHLILFSLLGTLARLAIQWLSSYPGAVVITPLVWANLAGSAMIGFLVEDDRLFRAKIRSRQARERRSNQGTQPGMDALAEESGSPASDQGVEDEQWITRKKEMPLYIGLTTGFCGCLTSFSTFARDSFLALSNDLPSTPVFSLSSPGPSIQAGVIPARNAAWSLPALLGSVILTPSLSLVGYHTGRHLAAALPRSTPRLPTKHLDPVLAVVAYTSYLVIIFLAAFPPSGHLSSRGTILFPLLFSPPGCLLRYYLSRWLNPRFPTFPLGTFLCNLLGTGVLGMAYDLQHSWSVFPVMMTTTTGKGLISCQVLKGVQEGFCGSLTTVSTWVVELDSLGRKRRRRAWRYGAGSVAVCVGLLVGVMGVMRWTVGWRRSICG